MDASFESLSEKSLLFLMSRGMSVAEWDRLGMLSREVAIYSKLSYYFRELWWLSYGRQDYMYKDYLAARGIHLITPGQDYFRENETPDSYEHRLLSDFPSFFRQFDYVKTNQYSAASLALKIKNQFGTKAIIRQGFFYPLRFRLTNKKIVANIIEYFKSKGTYQKADAIILTSHQSKKYIVENFSIPPEKVRVVYNYVDTELFKPEKVPSALSGDILFIGRFSFQKNIMNLLHATKNLDVKLTMIGNGRYRKHAEHFSRINGIQAEFIDQIPNEELSEIYNNHKIFLLPSRWEGNPKVLLEAMACGRPVIGANTWGINEIIEHRDNGYFCGKRPHSIRKAIKSLLTDKPLRSYLGKNARDYTLEKNDLKACIGKELEIYINISKSKKH